MPTLMVTELVHYFPIALYSADIFAFFCVEVTGTPGYWSEWCSYKIYIGDYHLV